MNYRRLVSALVASLLVMVIIVGGGALTAAFAQDALKYTGCVNRSGKIQFLAEGEVPLKSCKGKEIEIMFPSTLKTLQLQSNQRNLQHSVDNLVASNFFWIGGSTGNDSFCCSDQNTVRYMGPFVSRLAEKKTQVQQPVPSFAGTITSMHISIDEPLKETVLIYTLFPGGGLTCEIGPGEETSCSSGGCDSFLPDDQIYIKVEAFPEDDCPQDKPMCAKIPPSRWIAEFQPLDSC
jgi:hypothetical protein